MNAGSGIGLHLDLDSGLGQIYVAWSKHFLWSQFLQPGMRNLVPVNVSQNLSSSASPEELIKTQIRGPLNVSDSVVSGGL